AVDGWAPTSQSPIRVVAAPRAKGPRATGSAKVISDCGTVSLSLRVPSGSTAVIPDITLAWIVDASGSRTSTIVPGSESDMSTCARQIDAFTEGEWRLELIRAAM